VCTQSIPAAVREDGGQVSGVSMPKLTKRQWVELRRRAGEHYLQIRLGRGWTLRVRGGKVIAQTRGGAFEVVMPLRAILEEGGLHKRGF